MKMCRLIVVAVSNEFFYSSAKLKLCAVKLSELGGWLGDYT